MKLPRIRTIIVVPLALFALLCLAAIVRYSDAYEQRRPSATDDTVAGERQKKLPWK